ncbi:MAG: lipopolysaccharide/colanic/teichoic acid biosynthesis glycosyltransferase [Acidimicrobiales bacterium]|jgi:lipopolysaccharide/colanic/teichoic acid biosynthesis glycosyltransferase
MTDLHAPLAAQPSYLRCSPARSIEGDLADRTTPATRFLRRTSIDELSQLWNVVAGDMSLVGPRPEVLDKAQEQGLVGHRRHIVKPGMTGLWQISPARELEIRDGLAYDLRYLETLDLREDLRILALTPTAILRSHTN